MRRNSVAANRLKSCRKSRECLCSSVVEHFLGKEEVPGSSPGTGSVRCEGAKKGNAFRKRTDRKKLLGKKKEKSNCAAEAVHIQKKNYITTQKVSWQKNILIGPSRT